jgi:hypothetical protein
VGAGKLNITPVRKVNTVEDTMLMWELREGRPPAKLSTLINKALKGNKVEPKKYAHGLTRWMTAVQ